MKQSKNKQIKILLEKFYTYLLNILIINYNVISLSIKNCFIYYQVRGNFSNSILVFEEIYLFCIVWIYLGEIHTICKIMTKANSSIINNCSLKKTIALVSY